MNDMPSQNVHRSRGNRTASKSTIEEVMQLSRNLPLTRKVLAGSIKHATPSQHGPLADLFRAENLSREQSKRLRLLKNANFPQAKELDDYDWSTTGFPDDWGRTDLLTLDFVEHAQDLVLYGDVGTGKTHLAIALGRQACRSNIPTMFSTASSLIMRLRKSKQENALEHELDRIGRNRLLIIDELGYLPIDIDGARLLFQIIADSYERRSIVFTSNPEFSRWGDVFGDGDMAAAVIDRIVHHGRIIRFHGESYRSTHSLMNNQQPRMTAAAKPA
jgi:DNA replication protein DnaC